MEPSTLARRPGVPFGHEVELAEERPGTLWEVWLDGTIGPSICLARRGKFSRNQGVGIDKGATSVDALVVVS